MDFHSDASFSVPDDLMESDWVEHAPFVFWLLDVLRPDTFVEVRAGSLASPTKFEDASIDLLRIDAPSSFEGWRGKMSERGVVLLHDLHAGADEVWNELKSRYPSFQFVHGQGLGVLGVGEQLDPTLARLFEAGRDEIQRVRIQKIYERLGGWLTAKARSALIIERFGCQMEDLRREMEEASIGELNRLQYQLEKAQEALSFYKDRYEQAIASRSWQVTRPLRAITLKLQGRNAPKP